MAFLTLAYLLAFCGVSIIMIRNFKRDTKLKLVEKLLAVSVLFLVYEFCGIVWHSVYFIGILGQEPTYQQLLYRCIEIVKYDCFILVAMVIVSVFINSKTVVAH